MMAACLHPRTELLSGAYGRYVECASCGARAKATRDGTPDGELADADTRNARIDAHYYFDRLWKVGPLTRLESYEWLARELSLQQQDCHIRLFDVATCLEVIALAKGRMIGL